MMYYDKIDYIDQKHKKYVYYMFKSSERYLELIISILYMIVINIYQYISIFTILTCFLTFFDIFEDHGKIDYMDQKHNKWMYFTFKPYERYLELIISTIYDCNQCISIFSILVCDIHTFGQH